MSSRSRIVALATAGILCPLGIVALAGPASADTLITTQGAGNSRMFDETGTKVVLALIVECNGEGSATVTATLTQGMGVGMATGTGTDNITCQGDSHPFLVNVLITATAGTYQTGTALVTEATLAVAGGGSVGLAGTSGEGTDIDPE